MEVTTNTMRKITGQQPVQTKAKHSIAGFKLREGAPVGLKVTLRGQRMYEFLDRLVSIVLPRLRDFRGLSRKAFDPQGNYSIGLPDQTVFAELSYDDTAVTHGLQVNITTSTSDKAASARLLELLGLPFERNV
jgi:large subunit ribosomal protein L5